MNILAFRIAFPFFAEIGTYPDAMIQGWSDLASNSPLGGWYQTASLAEQQLLVAHIGSLMSQAAANGSVGGVIVSASEGSVSVGYEPPPSRTALGYYLNRSVYGQQLLAMLEIEAAGGQYVGGLPERNAYRKVGGVFW